MFLAHQVIELCQERMSEEDTLSLLQLVGVSATRRVLAVLRFMCQNVQIKKLLPTT